ncbi:MAG: DNA/RNA non-specific endonuclease [Mediterranea sp.]|jgi:endonuclease G|nr:DNA/RNA non-specific endonuclease [Mediterranea sp.]
MNRILLSWALLLFATAGCNDASNALPNGYIETTQEGSSTFVLKGFGEQATSFNVLQPQGCDKPFYITGQKFTGAAYGFVPSLLEERLSEMTTTPAESEWQAEAEIVGGRCYWARCANASSYAYLKLRVAYIEGETVGVEYIRAGDASRPNGNANTGEGAQQGYEVPALRTSYQYIAHTLSYNGSTQVNYSLEWVPERKHARWVAFTFDKWTSIKSVTRTDAWAVDPQLPAGEQTNEDDHRNDGFDKGHLVASEDRVYSKEANEQTFYYSNMSPQLAAFNQQYWASYEDLVQSWARSGGYDMLYVVKGGTLDQLLPSQMGADGKGSDASGYTVHGIAVPKYYFMAVVAQKGDSHQGIAFWMEHTLTGKASADQMKAKALSIRELEAKTEIDFFCNLPNDLEEAVEGNYDAAAWAWN